MCSVLPGRVVLEVSRYAVILGNLGSVDIDKIVLDLALAYLFCVIGTHFHVSHHRLLLVRI